MPEKYKDKIEFKMDWDGDPRKLTDAQLETILYAAEKAQLGREEADKLADQRRLNATPKVIEAAAEPEE
ncbi:MAG: hypothetical protein ACHQWV_04855, partial [Nitrospirales bacterium]